MRTLALLLALCLMAFAAPTRALDPAVRLSQFRHAQWDRPAGLPNSSVLAMAQTADGYLWVGTEEGLARFDGERFVVFDRRSSEAFRSNEVQALCTTPDGTLWIGTLDGAIRYDGKSFQRVATAGGERYRGIETLLCGDDGAVIAGVHGDGLQRLGSGTAEEFPGWHPHGGNSVTALARAADGTLWVGTFGSGLYICKKSHCALSAALPADAQVSALWIDREGTAWVGLYDAGLRLVHDDQAVRTEWAKALPTGVIWSIRGDADGSVWVAVRETGLLRVKSDTSVERIADFSADTPVYPHTLFEDAERNLWIGSEGGGLHRLSNVSVRSYGVAEGLAPHAAQAVLEDSERRLWIGTKGGGVNRLALGQISQWMPAGDTMAGVVTGLARTPDGQLRFATRAGVYLSDGAVSAQRDRSPASPTGLILGFFADSRGRVWAGGEPLLSYFEAGRWHTLGAADGFDGGSARVFAEGRDGTLWIGTAGQGLYRYRDGKFARFAAADGSTDATVLAVFVDSKGTVWFSVRDAGLQRLQGDRAVALGGAAGLPDQLFSIIEDDAGAFWLGSNSGLWQVSKADLDSVADGRLAHARPVLFDTLDGMRSSQCSRETQPLSWKGHDGVLWFATAAGVARVDPAHLARNARAPTVLIESVQVDNADLDLSEIADLPARPKHVEIRYTATSLTAPERVRFRYRLEGVDETWIDAADQRRVDYTALRGGYYRFLVSAANNDGVWSPAAASFAFSIAAPFTESLGFYALLAAIGGLVGAAYHRYRIVVLRGRTAVLLERNRIARELHDTVAQTFSGILMRLQVATHLVPENCDPLREQLQAVRIVARDSLNEVRQVVAQLRPDAQSGLDLSDILRQQCERQLRDTGIALRFRPAPAAAAMAPFAMHHLCRIVEEAVSNAVLHSGTREVVVEVESSARRTRVSVLDHGAADAPPVVGDRPRGTGLRGMAERAAEIGANLEIGSVAGGGTCVSVVLSHKARG